MYVYACVHADVGFLTTLKRRKWTSDTHHGIDNAQLDARAHTLLLTRGRLTHYTRHARKQTRPSPPAHVHTHTHAVIVEVCELEAHEDVDRHLDDHLVRLWIGGGGGGGGGGGKNKKKKTQNRRGILKVIKKKNKIY